jgi:hypothetical protein
LLNLYAGRNRASSGIAAAAPQKIQWFARFFDGVWKVLKLSVLNSFAIVHRCANGISTNFRSEAACLNGHSGAA